MLRSSSGVFGGEEDGHESPGTTGRCFSGYVLLSPGVYVEQRVVLSLQLINVGDENTVVRPAVAVMAQDGCTPER